MVGREINGQPDPFCFYPFCFYPFCFYCFHRSYSPHVYRTLNQ